MPDPHPVRSDLVGAAHAGARRADRERNAVLLVIGARREAAGMLASNGLAEFSDDFLGSRCRKTACSCGKYVGEGDFCERSTCRHSAGQHAT
ncbi:DUF6422 family protein [Streptomyces qaidamensis]|uniref:DUF6422 family protein n=1 Tax=Streptomyces qaidamensis TaxID=1783515 RepID=UPI003AACD173